MKRLEGKVAIVTGGSRGIGFAIVERFLEDGAKVAIVGSREETARAAEKKILEKDPNAEVLAVWARAQDENEIKDVFKKVMEKWGSVDILVNNAGISKTKAIEEMTDEDFTSVMDINVNAVFRYSKEAVKVMIENEIAGSIINTSSMVAINGSGNQSAYTASKAAVNGLTKSLARELGKHGIRVNAVAPGVVGTDLVAENVTDEMLAGLQAVTALGRYAEPDEIVGAYSYLASDDASFTTGTIIDVNGGIVV